MSDHDISDWQKRICQPGETLPEAAQRIRFDFLTENEKRLAITGQQDQFDAVPSYTERFKRNK